MLAIAPVPVIMKSPLNSTPPRLDTRVCQQCNRHGVMRFNTISGPYALVDVEHLEEILPRWSDRLPWTLFGLKFFFGQPSKDDTLHWYKVVTTGKCPQCGYIPNLPLKEGRRQFSRFRRAVNFIRSLFSEKTGVRVSRTKDKDHLCE